MGFLIRWVITMAALLTVAHILPGIRIEGWTAAIVAALVLGLVNAIIRPLLLIITLPVNILTLGIFTFFINGFLFYMTARFVKGFWVADFWSAFWGALVFSVISFFISVLVGAKH